MGYYAIVIRKNVCREYMEIRKNGFLSTQTSYPSDCSCDFHVGSGSGMSEKKNEKITNKIKKAPQVNSFCGSFFNLLNKLIHSLKLNKIGGAFNPAHRLFDL